jgi:hypothetical protein
MYRFYLPGLLEPSLWRIPHAFSSGMRLRGRWPSLSFTAFCARRCVNRVVSLAYAHCLDSGQEWIQHGRLTKKGTRVYGVGALA